LSAARDFEVGETIFEEVPLCTTTSCDGDAAMEATRALAADKRELFDTMHFDTSMAALADRTDEERRILSAWDLNAYSFGDEGRAMLMWIARIPHGCIPNCCIVVQDGRGKVVAATKICEGDVLMSWYPEQELLFWASTEARRLVLSKERRFTCGCQRCEGPDVCRELPCGCSADAYLRIAGPDKSWVCGSCKVEVSSSDLKRQLKREKKLTKTMLTVLEALSDGEMPADPEVLQQLSDEAEESLGGRHWIYAISLFAMHGAFRQAEPSMSLALGLAFLDWIRDRVVVGRICGGRFPPGYILKSVYDVCTWCLGMLAEAKSSSGADMRLLTGRLMQLAVDLSNEATWAAEPSRLAEYKKVVEQNSARRLTCFRPGCEEAAASECRCGTCGFAGYCCEDCQAQDRTSHEVVCCEPLTPFIDMLDPLNLKM